MTPETACPSHIEARERLAAWAARFGPEVTCPVGVGPDPNDLRTLLDAPTQEGVGREEIAEIVWEALHSVGPDGIAEPEIAEEAIEKLLSLLPAPKLGEGLEADVARAWAEESGDRSNAIGCVQTQPQQPAPGVPEGWRDRMVALARDYDNWSYGNRTEINARTAADLRWSVWTIDALTSSSAKPGGEAFPGANAVGAYVDGVVAPLEAMYRDQIRRLREGLEECARTFRRYAQLHYDKGTPEGQEKGAANIALAQMCDAALKDNGRG